MKKTSRHREETKIRNTLLLQDYLNGMSYFSIAGKYNISHSLVCIIVNECLDSVKVEAGERKKTQLLHRYENLLDRLESKIRIGDIDAIREARATLSAIAKLLGFDSENVNITQTISLEEIHRQKELIAAEIMRMRDQD